jgi:hypothetical protein
VDIPNLHAREELKKWFAINRTPSRRFHVIPKHGENGAGNWSGASPLECNCQHAQELLNTATGKDTKELFNLDAENNKMIVFKSENDPNNQYHGYHVDRDSSDVPNEIKSLFV